MSCKDFWAQEMAGRLQNASRIAAGQVDGAQRCTREGCDALINRATGRCVRGHAQQGRGLTQPLAMPIVEALACYNREQRAAQGLPVGVGPGHYEDTRVLLAQYALARSLGDTADQMWVGRAWDGANNTLTKWFLRGVSREAAETLLREQGQNIGAAGHLLEPAPEFLARAVPGYGLAVPRGDAAVVEWEQAAVQAMLHLAEEETAPETDEAADPRIQAGRAYLAATTGPAGDQFEGDNALVRGGVRVAWEDLGEGLDGEYNEDDPNDVPLLRFNVYRRDSATAAWEEVEHASYCTRMPAEAGSVAKRRGLEILMNRFYDAVVADDGEAENIAEELSWIGPDDVLEQQR